MEYKIPGTAHSYEDILDGNVPVPTPEVIAMSVDEKALQQAEEIVKVNKARANDSACND